MNMNKFQKGLLIGFSVPTLSTLIIYLAGSFGFADFDISNWGDNGRGLLAFLWLVINLGNVAYLIFNNIRNKSIEDFKNHH